MGNRKSAVDTLVSVALFLSTAGRGEPCGADFPCSIAHCRVACTRLFYHGAYDRYDRLVRI